VPQVIDATAQEPKHQVQQHDEEEIGQLPLAALAEMVAVDQQVDHHGTHQPEYGPRGPCRQRVVADKTGHAPADSSQQIHGQEAPAAKKALHIAPEDQQGIRVHGEMQKPDVQKDRRDEAPVFTLQDGQVILGAKADQHAQVL